MKDNQLLMMVLRKPLTYPYFDINALRCVEPAETRYKAAVVELDSEEACVLGLPRDHVPEIVLAQYQAGKYLAKRLEEIGIRSARGTPRVSGGRSIEKEKERTA